MAMVGLRTHYVLNERNNRGVAVNAMYYICVRYSMYTVVEFFGVGLHYICFEYHKVVSINACLFQRFAP